MLLDLEGTLDEQQEHELRVGADFLARKDQILGLFRSRTVPLDHDQCAGPSLMKIAGSEL